MFPTVQSNTNDLRSALSKSQVTPSDNSGAGKAFIKFNYKDGSFTFGREAEDISGETIIINTATIHHGWTMWVNGSPTKVSASFAQPLPEQPAPVDGNAPTESRSFEAAFPEKEDDTVLVFDSNSYGGRKGVDAVLQEVISRSGLSDTAFLFPVVQLNSESYTAKQGGLIHNPVFAIVDWMDVEGNLESASKKIAEEKPKRRRRAKA